MNSRPAELAIVIPAFKSRHLASALESLSVQTNRSFNLYVGDDASAEPILEIVKSYAGRLPLSYHRFDENLGGISLVQQWHRCIALTHEPWIWVFSDDDIAEPGCVEAFLHALQSDNEEVDLYRFNMTIMDSAGREVARPSVHPARETSADFLRAVLTNRVRQIRVPDHIFSRAVFERQGGFQDLPAALFADHATWTKFSHPRGIQTLAGPGVRWRAHGTSVSAQTGKYRREYLRALEEFCRWLLPWAQHTHPVRVPQIRRDCRSWFFKELSLHCGLLDEHEQAAVKVFALKMWPEQKLEVSVELLAAVLKPRLRKISIVGKLLNWRHRRLEKKYLQQYRSEIEDAETSGAVVKSQNEN